MKIIAQSRIGFLERQPLAESFTGKKPPDEAQAGKGMSGICFGLGNVEIVQIGLDPAGQALPGVFNA